MALTIVGFAEAPFFPGGVLLMSSWYTRAELTRRLAWFYTGTSLANMFGGLIGYAVLRDLSGAHGIAGWVWTLIKRIEILANHCSAGSSSWKASSLLALPSLPPISYPIILPRPAGSPKKKRHSPNGDYSRTSMRRTTPSPIASGPA